MVSNVIGKASMPRGNSEVRDYFDDWSKSYDTDVGMAHWIAPDRVFEAARSFLEKDSRILDVAIGTGLLSAQFRKAAGGTYITGLDISPVMLEECAEKGVADTLKRCDVERQRFPVRDHTVDLTVASGVFEFLGSLENVFSEMARVTRRGGIIAFSYTPNSGLKTKVYSNDAEVPLYSHCPKQIEQLLSRHGVEKLISSPVFTGYNPGRVYPNRVFVGRVL